jgi:hypothetical protein
LFDFFSKVNQNLEQFDWSWLHCPSYDPKEPVFEKDSRETPIEVSSDDDDHVAQEGPSSEKSNGFLLTKDFR